MLHGLRSIHATEGIRGYFAGLTPALFGVSHGALYFGVYERLKAWRRDRGKGGEKMTNLDTIFMSSAAKVVAGTATYPHQVVRTRMQNYGAVGSTSTSAPNASHTATSTTNTPQAITRKGLMVTIRNIWKEEGVMAFYKGLGPNLVRVVPNSCVTFLVYENVRAGLPRLWGSDADDQGNGKGI
jgi:solute carrier family 25 folate transporter 32